MAINLIIRNVKKFQGNNLGQRFKNLLILDFEATCEKNFAMEVQEIIEFPCIAVNTNDWKIENTFHEYVKPKVNPILTGFCTELTGIMQDFIDNEQHFPVVFEQFNKWLVDNNYVSNPEQSAFVTCGSWDIKVMLRNQCALDKILIPSYLHQWIDLKTVFCEATEYYPRSLKDMLVQLKLPLEGRLHSGIHDATNMARIIRILGTEFPIRFDTTSSLYEKKLL